MTNHDLLAGEALWVRVADITGRIFIDRLALAQVAGVLDMELLPLGPLVVSVGADSGLLKEMLVIHVEP